MANRYWVGGSGNWTDNTNHWSASSGGAPGASVPTSADDVYFNASSFSGGGQTVTLNTSQDCGSMNWSGATNSPTFSHSGTLSIYGSLTLIAAMTDSGGGGLLFKAGSGSWTITTNGLTGLEYWYFGQGIGASSATWTLQDNLTASGSVTLVHGTLNTNGKDVSIYGFDGTNGDGTLTLGASNLWCGSSWLALNASLTLSAASSTIYAYSGFQGGGKTYGTVKLESSGTCYLSGSNTLGSLIVDAVPKAIYFTPGTTQTVTAFTAVGTAGNLITLGRNGSYGVWTISKPSGTVSSDYLVISNSVATGGATWNAGANSTDGGGNSGWVFGGAPPATLYGPAAMLGANF